MIKFLKVIFGMIAIYICMIPIGFIIATFCAPSIIYDYLQTTEARQKSYPLEHWPWTRIFWKKLF